MSCLNGYSRHQSHIEGQSWWEHCVFLSCHNKVFIFDFVILVENIHFLIVYDCLDGFLATVTDFNFISVEYLFNGAVFWEIGIY